MKKSFIAAAALALMASVSARAADVITEPQPELPPEPVAAAPAAPSAVDWNGVYAGGMIGGSWGDVDTRLKLEKNRHDKTRLVKNRADPSIFIGGFYAGYNFQPPALANSAKNLVLSVETDFLLDSGGGEGDKFFNAGNGMETYSAEVRQKWNGATRLRLGYAVGDEGRFLPYIAGGVSYAEIRGRYRMAEGKVGRKDKNAIWSNYLSQTKSVAGWNAGAGVDYIPPVLDNHLIVRAEYRHTGFGSQNFNKVKRPDGSVLKQQIDYKQDDFRVGVAYKF